MLLYAQVSLAGTAPNAPPTLEDPKFWTAEEKKTQKIDRLARSLLIQGLLNDIYSLIDSNDTAKDLWDALERQMRGSEYGEQDRKAASFIEYGLSKLLKVTIVDTYLRYLQLGTLMRQTKNLMDINIDALYNILKQNQGDVNDVMGYKKKAVVVTSDPLALVAEKTKVSKRKEKVVVQSEFRRKTSSASSSANKKPEYVKSEEKKEDKKADEKKRDMSKVKCYNCKKDILPKLQERQGKDYNYIQRKMLLAKKDSDETDFLLRTSLDGFQRESSSSAEKHCWVSYYTSDSESESEYETSEYYDNSTNYGLFVDNDDDQEIFHDAIEFASENFNENHIVSQTDHDQSEVDHNDSEEKRSLVDK
ncbi:hypothetical protein Tco_0393548 [Tanacetum coccineum]